MHKPQRAARVLIELIGGSADASNDPQIINEDLGSLHDLLSQVSGIDD